MFMFWGQVSLFIIYVRYRTNESNCKHVRIKSHCTENLNMILLEVSYKMSIAPQCYSHESSTYRVNAVK